MKIRIQAAVVALFAASVAQAQQAVQWRVQDGGNGHWYQVASVNAICWEQARVDAEASGGHLATLVTVAEDAWLRSQLPELPWYFIGGRQDPNACEPSCGWYWITGEQFLPLWDASQPDGDLPWTVPQDILTTYRRGWHDGPDCGDQSNCGGGCPLGGYVVEWSADCNNDGIVDYGQCRDGSLPDYNCNNIPDCCEHGQACLVGSYPVQWKVSDGGNGHWYQMVVTSAPTRWQEAKDLGQRLGGHLVSITSSQENQVCLNVAANGPLVPGGSVWLGASQASDAAPYSWVTGEPFAWTPGCGFSNTEQSCGFENYVTMTSPWTGCSWNDVAVCWEIPGMLVEWEADCNNDGIVDYGQILQGQLVDLDADGIPDICQQPTCIDADIFRDFNVNGADLGILLSQWGPNTPLTESDLNKDGAVDGADLGLLLSFWGPCP